METLAFDLVTPQATFFSGKVSMVEAPGTLGDFGVLPGHMNFISTLRPGAVRVHVEGQGVLSIFVVGGIAEVNPESCTILAEEVEDLSTITRAMAETRLTEAKAALENAFEEAAREEMARRAAVAEAILEALAA